MIKIHSEKFFAILIFIFLSCGLSGCKDYDEIISDARSNKRDHQELRVFDGEVEPPFPDESKNNKTVFGIDENTNGIRDDIDIWINYVGVNYNHRMALRQLARQEVKILSATSTENAEAYDQIAKDIRDGDMCTGYMEYSHFDNKVSPSSLLTKLTFNTSLRIKAYKKMHEASLVYKSKIENISTITAYRACDFKVEKLQELIDFRKSRSH